MTNNEMLAVLNTKVDLSPPGSGPVRPGLTESELSALGNFVRSDEGVATLVSSKGDAWTMAMVFEWSSESDGVEYWRPFCAVEGPDWESARHLWFADSGYLHYPSSNTMRVLADLLDGMDADVAISQVR